MKVFKNAQEAFTTLYDYISENGVEFAGTKAIFNEGFTLLNPKDRMITSEFRKFNLEYTEAEWKWYLSADPSVQALGDIYGKVPMIWKRMADEDGNVRSNYGWQWSRNNQLNKVIDSLKANNQTRQAAISIYDGKEIDTYSKDTPCTYAVQFTVLDSKLNMSVLMRSNDLWHGFCIDQYCFSKLQEYVSEQTGYEMGTYFHYAHNMHIYNNFLNRK